LLENNSDLAGLL